LVRDLGQGAGRKEVIMHSNLSDPINQAIEQSERDGGIWIRDLKSGDRVLITTRNSVYSLVKTSEKEYTIEGHPQFCPTPVTVQIAGSTWGGSMLKMGWIGVGMHLEFRVPHFGTLTTSRIKSVEIVK
jgi:hypothetical protein